MKIVNPLYSNFFSNGSLNNAGSVNANKNATVKKEITVNDLNKWELNEIAIEKLPKWDLNKVPLKYFVENGCKDPKFLPQFVNTVDSCFIPWMRASYGLIRFQRVFNKNSADIIVEWTDTTVLGRDYEAGHNNLKVISNKIEKAEITIVIYPEIDKGISPSSRIERVRRTALHEIGHSLGLNHSQNSKDMMFYRGINNNKLSSNDIERLNQLYSNKSPKLSSKII